VSAGADVMLVGPMPTPAIAFITSSMRADAGVVISASHNPIRTTASRYSLPTVSSCPTTWRQTSSAAWATPRPPRQTRTKHWQGYSHRRREGRYVQFLKHTFPKTRTLDGVRVVVDCANGAAYRVAPQGVTELGADLTVLSASRTGAISMTAAGPCIPKKWRLRCAAPCRHRHRARRRRRPRDPDGRAREIVDGDQIMAILGTRLLARQALPGNTVVATVMSNLGLERVLAARNGTLLRPQWATAMSSRPCESRGCLWRRAVGTHHLS